MAYQNKIIQENSDFYSNCFDLYDVRSDKEIEGMWRTYDMEANCEYGCGNNSAVWQMVPLMKYVVYVSG